MKEKLIQAGLSSDEVDVYIDLVEHGAETASQIAKHTKVKRTYVYKLAQDLANRGLVIISKKGNVTTFEPQPPENILTLIENKKAEVRKAEAELETILPELKKMYSSVGTKPTVTYHEGISGLKTIYRDILSYGKDYMLIRSIYDSTTEEMDQVVDEQVKSQIKKGIHVRMIAPHNDKYTLEQFRQRDKQRLVDRRTVKNFDFNLASQVIIYGNKVALISLKSGLVITLIDNRDISETFKTIFEFMWIAAEEKKFKI